MDVRFWLFGRGFWLLNVVFWLVEVGLKLGGVYILVVWTLDYGCVCV